MTRKDKRPSPIVRKGPKGLYPVNAHYAEVIHGDAMGTEYDLVKRTRRSLPQLGLYWSVLTKCVRATDRWANAEKLHEALKMACGFVTTNYTMAGEPFYTVDSIAFDKMDADQFREYFDAAMRKLAEHLGFDPLEP